MDVELSMQFPSSVNISRIVDRAAELGKRTTVSRLLVTSALVAGFSRINVTVESDSGMPIDDETALWWCGLGSTRFYVSDRLTGQDVEGVRRGRTEGTRTYILIPENCVDRARLLTVGSSLATTVAVTSIEDFLGQLIDRLGQYEPDVTRTWFEMILRIYNERVAAAGADLDTHLTAQFISAVSATPSKDSRSVKPD